MGNWYEERQKARRQRLEERAEKKREQAAATHERSRFYTQGIPFGQPTLVGHHSERRHRNAVDKSWNALGKAVRLSDEAESLETRASAVGSGGISADDPDAIAKLTEKLAEKEALHKRIKKGRAAGRKNDTEALKALGFNSAPEAFWLTNNGAEIRRIKARIKSLEAQVLREGTRTEYPWGELVRCPDENRIMFEFVGKPHEDVRVILKRHGFKWSRYQGAWVRKWNGNAEFAAKWILREMTKLTIEADPRT